MVTAKTSSFENTWQANSIFAFVFLQGTAPQLAKHSTPTQKNNKKDKIVQL